MSQQRSMRSTALLAALLASGALSSAPVLAQDEGSPTGTLSIAFASDIDSLDPAIGYDFVSWPAERLIYETLVTYDDGTTLIPGLAEDLPQISDDGLTYTFTLRDGIDFVRRGEIVREVTADDVVFSINRVLRPDLLPHPSPVSEAFFASIVGADAVLDGSAETAAGLKALDERTVEITLSAPDRTFINALAMPFGSVMPVEAGYDATNSLADPVGTGPFYLESYTPGEIAIFRANPHYWGEPGPLVDTIEYRLLVPQDTQAQQVQAGELDINGDNLPTPAYLGIKDDPTYADRLKLQPQLQFSYLAMDTAADGPLSDVRVRQAISHAIDRENQARISGGRDSVGTCLFPPELPGYDETCLAYPYDVDAARALMAEAGVDGFSTQLYTDTAEQSVLAAESAAADLAEIGIDVEVILQDWDTLLGTISTPRAAPLVFIGWFADFPDPSNFIDPILSCASAVEGGANSSWWCDEAIDAAGAEARTITDLDEAIPIYRELQRQIMAQAPLVPLIYPSWTTLISDRVTGLESLHPLWTWELAKYGVTG
jgi:oligopeptide transport system substrate-binding protein